VIIIPAIDLKNGLCVRLVKGKIDSQTVYSKDPTAIALRFEMLGAEKIHLVDLDGAFKGKRVNHDTISTIVKNVSIPVQVGGGIRDEADFERIFEIGVHSVIVGTLAVKKPKILENALKRYPCEKIILGVDTRNRKISIQGWQKDTLINDVDFAKKWSERGIQRIVYTDILRDGMLSGPNILALKDFAVRSKLKIVASGGVSSIKDLEKIKNLKKVGVDQVIIGKAIYEGKLNLEEILKC
tara:strand:+ start:707 stop:1426 length:720 start_codon:yes stop_codon:yes gene_type:complete